MKILAWGVFALIGVSHAASTVDLTPLVADEQAKVVAWRRDIHEHPELSNREVRTSNLVAAHLKACGHDAHTAMLMGVADILAKVRGGLAGNVLFLFQPAEEGAPEGEEGGAALHRERCDG